MAAAPLSLIEKSAEIENCDRKLQAAADEGRCGERVRERYGNFTATDKDKMAIKIETGQECVGGRT